MTLSRKDDSQRPFEYACHEGNYAMFHLLRRRAEDKAAGRREEGHRPHAHGRN
jgi:hypothetical protein